MTYRDDKMAVTKAMDDLEKETTGREDKMALREVMTGREKMITVQDDEMASRNAGDWLIKGWRLEEKTKWPSKTKWRAEKVTNGWKKITVKNYLLESN